MTDFKEYCMLTEKEYLKILSETYPKVLEIVKDLHPQVIISIGARLFLSIVFSNEMSKNEMVKLISIIYEEAEYFLKQKKDQDETEQSTA